MHMKTDSKPFIHCGGSALLISVPHAGTEVPADLRERFSAPARLLPDTDWNVDRLYKWAVAAGAGAAGIETEERVMSVKQKVLAFLREEEGLTTVEYAIGGGLVGLAVVLAFTDLGEAVADVIRNIIGAISG